MIPGEIPAPAISLGHRDFVLHQLSAIAFGAADPRVRKPQLPAGQRHASQNVYDFLGIATGGSAVGVKIFTCRRPGIRSMAQNSHSGINAGDCRFSGLLCRILTCHLRSLS
jgi:hypothetical protein